MQLGCLLTSCLVQEAKREPAAVAGTVVCLRQGLAREREGGEEEGHLPDCISALQAGLVSYPLLCNTASAQRI